MVLVLKREGESDLEKGMTLEIALRSAFPEYHVILGIEFWSLINNNGPHNQPLEDEKHYNWALKIISEIILALTF